MAEFITVHLPDGGRSSVTGDLTYPPEAIMDLVCDRTGLCRALPASLAHVTSAGASLWLDPALPIGEQGVTREALKDGSSRLEVQLMITALPLSLADPIAAAGQDEYTEAEILGFEEGDATYDFSRDTRGCDLVYKHLEAAVLASKIPVPESISVRLAALSVASSLGTSAIAHRPGYLAKTDINSLIPKRISMLHGRDYWEQRILAVFSTLSLSSTMEARLSYIATCGQYPYFGFLSCAIMADPVLKRNKKNQDTDLSLLVAKDGVALYKGERARAYWYVAASVVESITYIPERGCIEIDVTEGPRTGVQVFPVSVRTPLVAPKVKKGEEPLPAPEYEGTPTDAGYAHFVSIASAFLKGEKQSAHNLALPPRSLSLVSTSRSQVLKAFYVNLSASLSVEVCTPFLEMLNTVTDI
ncbi:hypothetical protein KIPB_007914 [Kipferlia bialata]|uniref:FERM domain-containing protein n=1 Tax=Kipferlia bialata TaxID=797122 RepID=A0A9K3CZ97_9EUKA|nr:hypothetical protein KIPB_007914 [Kipferlia bialata]|eukprot:g7914.t1